MSGLLRPTHGRVIIAGRDVTGVSGDALARAGVCVIQEGRGIFPRLTVEEHLRLAMPNGDAAAELLTPVYEQFPRLAERQRQYAGTLSGGEQQMLALSRALIWNPPLLDHRRAVDGTGPPGRRAALPDRASARRTGQRRSWSSSSSPTTSWASPTQALVLQHGRVVRTDTPAAIAQDLAELYLAAAPSGSGTRS